MSAAVLYRATHASGDQLSDLCARLSQERDASRASVLVQQAVSCLHGWAADQAAAEQLQLEELSQLSSAIATSFWLESAHGSVAVQLCEASIVALTALAASAHQAQAAPLLAAPVASAVQPIVHTLCTSALPKLTDVGWALAVGLEIFKRFMHCCMQALELLTSCFVASLPSLNSSAAPQAVQCASSWVMGQLTLASRALELAARPDVPAELRAFFVVNSAWKQIVRLAAECPQQAARVVQAAFAAAFSTSWEQLLVRCSADTSSLQAQLDAFCVRCVPLLECDVSNQSCYLP
jgi:hypothetical protein